MINDPDVSPVIPVVKVVEFSPEVIRPSQVVEIVKIKIEAPGNKYIIVLVAHDRAVFAGKGVSRFPVYTGSGGSLIPGTVGIVRTYGPVFIAPGRIASAFHFGTQGSLGTAADRSRGTIMIFSHSPGFLHRAACAASPVIPGRSLLFEIGGPATLRFRSTGGSGFFILRRFRARTADAARTGF